MSLHLLPDVHKCQMKFHGVIAGRLCWSCTCGQMYLIHRRLFWGTP